MNRLNRRECLRSAGLYALSLLLMPGLSADEPRVTISPLNHLSDEDEIDLGKHFAESLDKDEPVVSTPMIGSYLQPLVLRLARNSRRPDLPYNIKLINSRAPNAFSLPGGFLYVNRGLIELVETEDELVAALAHEIGHVVGRHVVNRLMLNLEARSLLSPLLENLHRENGVIERMILGLGGAVETLAMLHFSREDEAQADLLGFYDMLRAGWNPRGFLQLFAQLHTIERSSGALGIPFFSDHPPTPERAAAIRRELAQVVIPKDAVTDSAEFHSCKSSMRLLPEPPAHSAHESR
jgi:beta-barrel assembly-enhancing protease